MTSTKTVGLDKLVAATKKYPFDNLRPDDRYQQERQDYEWHRAALQSYEQDIAQRKEYAGKLFSLFVGWLIAVFILLLGQGVGSKIGFFSLSDKVLITLLSGTTANLLGLLYVVAKYLFSERNTEIYGKVKSK